MTDFSPLRKEGILFLLGALAGEESQSLDWTVLIFMATKGRIGTWLCPWPSQPYFHHLVFLFIVCPYFFFIIPHFLKRRTEVGRINSNFELLLLTLLLLMIVIWNRVLLLMLFLLFFLFGGGTGFFAALCRTSCW